MPARAVCGYIGVMFEVLVFVYENYWRGDACPELHQLERKLSAHGFEPDEIHEALVWLDGLNVAAQNTLRPSRIRRRMGPQPSDASMRVYSVAEQDHLGAHASASSLPRKLRRAAAALREIVSTAPWPRRATRCRSTPEDHRADGVLALRHEPDALILDELCDDRGRSRMSRACREHRRAEGRFFRFGGHAYCSSRSRIRIPDFASA
jgi:Smg protein